MTRYSPNPTVNRLDYRQDWLESGVDDGIIDLNVEAIATGIKDIPALGQTEAFIPNSDL